jgi:hypothetical protein
MTINFVSECSTRSFDALGDRVDANIGELIQAYRSIRTVSGYRVADLDDFCYLSWPNSSRLPV